MKKLFFIINLLLITLFASAQWIWQNPLPTGNDLSSVYFTDANTGYTVGQAGTILKTIDGGQTWTTMESGTTKNLNSVFFPDANNGFVIGNDGTILKTSNGGTTWNLLSSGTEMDLFSVCFTDLNTGYAVGGDFESGIVLKTVNGGTSWTSLSIGTSYCLNSVYFTDANTGYAVGLMGTCLKTSDGGLTWTDLASTFDDIEAIYFTDPENGYLLGAEGIMLKTINGGTNWKSLNWDTFEKSRTKINLSSVSFIDANTGYAVGGFTLKKYTSADSISYQDSTSCGIILKTIDGGTTWNEILSGNINYLRSVFFSDANTGYVVGERGTIFKTHDGGNNWTSLSKAPTYLGFISVRFLNSNVGYVVTENSNVAGSYFSLMTTDGGINWTPLTIENPFAVYFIDTNTGYAVKNKVEKESFSSEIFKTKDSGRTWTAQWNSNEFIFFSIYFIDSNNGVAVGGSVNSGSIILKTLDGGKNWVKIKSGETAGFLFAVCFTDDNTGYAVGSSEIVTVGDYKGGHILKTIDAGSTWVKVFDNDTINPLISVHFPDANTGYAVGTMDGCSSIVKTSDGGQTWTILYHDTDDSETSSSLTSVFFTDANTGYVIGKGDSDEGIIWKTFDGGNSWTSIPIPTTNLLSSVYFTDANTGYAVGSGGTILKTTNAGGYVGLGKNLTLESTYTIYPNPANNKITISNNKGWHSGTIVRIYNVKGELVIQDKYHFLDSFELDVSELRKGIYLVKILNGSVIETKKLLVQ